MSRATALRPPLMSRFTSRVRCRSPPRWLWVPRLKERLKLLLYGGQNYTTCTAKGTVRASVLRPAAGVIASATCHLKQERPGPAAEPHLLVNSPAGRRPVEAYLPVMQQNPEFGNPV